jgi:hypothetical protein
MGKLGWNSHGSVAERELGELGQGLSPQAEEGHAHARTRARAHTHTHTHTPHYVLYYIYFLYQPFFVFFRLINLVTERIWAEM